MHRDIPYVLSWGLYHVIVIESQLVHGSFETEAFENEDRSTEHPNLKTKHPKIENEAPKTRNLSFLLKHEIVPCQVISSRNQAR